MTEDWKEAFFKMARIAFDESADESSAERILAALGSLEDQGVVIDFLEGLFNDDDFDDDSRQKIVPYFIEKAKEGIKAKEKLLELEAAIQIKEIEEREALKEENLGTVGKIVEIILKKNMRQYPVFFVQLIPKEMLDTKLTNENLHEIGKKIDEIRLQKENELATMLNMVKPDEKNMQRLRKVINEEKGPSTFTIIQKQKIKQIKFLSSVVQAIRQ